MKKKTYIFLLIILSVLAVYPENAFGGDGKGQSIKMGALMPKDSTGRHTRMLQDHLVAAKGEIQFGTQIAYANISSNDSELYLFLRDIDAYASFFRVAPFISYTYSDNHALGFRMAYTSVNGNISNGVADLLNEGLVFGGELDARARVRGVTAEVYHRTYRGLDNRGIVGLFWDFNLGYSIRKIETGTGENYSFANKFFLSFNPGICVYPVDNISVYFSLSLADVSFNNVKDFENMKSCGGRTFWDARLKPSLTEMNLGLAFHF